MPRHPESAIASSRTDSLARRTAILESATRSFSTYGLRGSSLRDIAREAGVSLTLLDHHFGSKAMLLEAVVGAHREVCLKKIAPLRASLMVVDGSLDLARLVREWVDYEFALSNTRQGRHDLHLTLRLAADTEVDAVVRSGINCSERIFMDALRLVSPGLGELRLRGAWSLASAALYAAVLSIDESAMTATSEEAAEFRDETRQFLTSGLSRICMPVAAHSL